MELVQSFVNFLVKDSTQYTITKTLMELVQSFVNFLVKDSTQYTIT